MSLLTNIIHSGSFVHDQPEEVSIAKQCGNVCWWCGIQLLNNFDVFCLYHKYQNIEEILSSNGRLDGNIPKTGPVTCRGFFFSEDVEEFLFGCMRLRGEAKALDLAKLMHSHAWLLGLSFGGKSMKISYGHGLNYGKNMFFFGENQLLLKLYGKSVDVLWYFI